MTFGIGFVAPYYAGIVTDRRLSGATQTDDSDKCGVVRYVDGRFAYTFAGLAGVPTLGFETHQKLAKMLCEAGRPFDLDQAPATTEEALARVADQMTTGFSKMRIQQRNKKTSVLFSGYGNTADGNGQGRLHLISNFESLYSGPQDSPRDRFTIESADVNNCGAAWVGSADLHQGQRTRLLDLLEKSKVVSPEEVVKLLVGSIREAAAKDQVIGSQCSSIVIPRARHPALIGYHSDEVENRVPLTATIAAAYGNEGAYYSFDHRLADARFKGDSVAATVPPVHKRQECPCGSGRRYQHCHGSVKEKRPINSYVLSGKLAILALPEDGSEMEIMSTDVLP